MLKKLTGFIAIAVFSLSVAACGGGSDCDAVGKHMMDIAEKQMGSASEEEKKLAKAMLPALKDEIVKQCKENKWPEEYRKCFVGADTEEAMKKCGEPPMAGGADKAAPADEEKSE